MKKPWFDRKLNRKHLVSYIGDHFVDISSNEYGGEHNDLLYNEKLIDYQEHYYKQRKTPRGRNTY